MLQRAASRESVPEKKKKKKKIEPNLSIKLRRKFGVIEPH